MKYKIIEINTNTYTINITNREYNKIINVIKKIKDKYSNQINIYNDYKLETIYKNNIIIKTLLKEIISYYPQIKKYNTTIFLIGSYARCTNKINSDIDIQYSYDPKYKNEMIKYEEIINYIISEVLSIERIKLHPMILCKLDNKVIEYVDNNIDNKEFIFKIKSPNNIIEYKYPKNLKRRIYIAYNTDNSLENTFKYIKNEIKNKNREWAHVFYPLTNKNLFNKEYKKLLEYEKKNLNNNKINNRKKELKYKIKNIENDIKTQDTNDISVFKKIYQIDSYALFNEYISLIRDIEIEKNKDWDYINYYDNYKYLKNNKIFNMILDYMNTLTTIAEKIGNNYSIHKSIKINIEIESTLKNKLLEINKNIGEEIK